MPCGVQFSGGSKRIFLVRVDGHGTTCTESDLRRLRTTRVPFGRDPRCREAWLLGGAQVKPIRGLQADGLGRVAQRG